MKKILLTIISFGALFDSNAQDIYGFNLDTNNVKAYVSDAGNFFGNPSDFSPAFEVPIGSLKHVCSSMAFWIGGRDINGQLKGAFQRYSGERDWFPGTLSLPAAVSLPYNSSRISNITSTDIDNFLADFNDDGVLQGSHDEVFNWPAHGNVGQDQDYYLAPFVDVNNDQMYNPQDGDYPCIKGDEAVYLILNDKGDIHASGSDPIGVELRLMFYQYRDSTVNNNSIFVDVEVINQGTQSLFDTYFGVFLDGDIGFGQDDYFGCDSTTSAMYFYNGDSFDETSGGTQGYENLPPAFGVKSLISPASSIVGFSSIQDPNSPLACYNLLTGMNVNGQPFPQGPFLYDASESTSPNTEGANFNPPGDRRGLLSIDVGNFSYLDEFKEAFVFTYSNANDSLNPFQSVEQLLLDFDKNTIRYNNDSPNCFDESTASTGSLEQNNLSVFPNPTEDILKIELEGDFEYTLLSLDGRILVSGTAINSHQLDFTGLSSGSYVLSVRTDAKEYKQTVVKL